MAKRNIPVTDDVFDKLTAGKMPNESWNEYLTTLVDTHPGYTQRVKMGKMMNKMIDRARKGDFGESDDDEDEGEGED